MSGISIITGGGSGVGAALAKRFVERSRPVLIVGRREANLLETKQSSSNPSLIRTVVADVSCPNGRRAIYDSLKDDEYVDNLVHNAAVLEPVSPLLNVKEEDWMKHMAINVDGPLFLTQTLFPKLRRRDENDGDDDNRGGRILHISSGAAHHGYRGWGPYCTSKAALHMVYQVLAAELAPLGIAVGSARPGVVDTPMQDLIRTKNETDMPDVSRFKIMKEQGSLVNPEEVAQFLDWLLHETDDVEFSEKEWDVRDDEFYHRWEHYI
mmetsp:Transcript_1720/g.2466  ORF Transcript_1720/g.2466 Transcript_1720/m.2466 type:complete len:266 (-) Transcript_1720:263-1060(-)|eukprot:CAMPEP_0203648400 /NCGR_PEP_ID=MMETSP0088-20131115/18709_1 /ASSEMBLY_ACC=CAM_ASM_001087 /TAXON_ID=426623 /ORGANISM="Chaetoceros affinis, Strain CCMP159" /LENGTH=265 /DNA_ID=CAMNT_0050506389 /DNA_START=41 /DNA_END=838 /DNA_ORIENTATION=+